MFRRRSFWVYSLGLAIAWAIVLTIILLARPAAATTSVLLVFAGFCIGWVSTTIARYLYPAANRWSTPSPGHPTHER